MLRFKEEKNITMKQECSVNYTIFKVIIFSTSLSCILLEKAITSITIRYWVLRPPKTNRYLQTNTIFVFTYSRGLEYIKENNI